MKQRLIDANKLTLLDVHLIDGKFLCDAPTVMTIPDNPTNGDMIKALFPYFEIYDNADNEEYTYVEVVVSKTDSTCYRKSWWNAPYKKEAENE